MSDDGFLALFGALASSMGGGGDKGNMFPESDAEDLSRGASHIPYEVTDARRAGEKVVFVQAGSQEEWFWKMSDGSRIYHHGTTMSAKDVEEAGKSGEYTTRYTDEVMERLGEKSGPTGFSPRKLAEMQEEGQRAVAENSKWRIASKTGTRRDDSREMLERLGFEIVQEVDNGYFYEVVPPGGWTKETNGYWTTVYDEDGNERLSQFYKSAFYDYDAFVDPRS